MFSSTVRAYHRRCDDPLSLLKKSWTGTESCVRPSLNYERNLPDGRDGRREEGEMVAVG